MSPWRGPSVVFVSPKGAKVQWTDGWAGVEARLRNEKMMGGPGCKLLPVCYCRRSSISNSPAHWPSPSVALARRGRVAATQSLMTGMKRRRVRRAGGM